MRQDSQYVHSLFGALRNLPNMELDNDQALMEMLRIFGSTITTQYMAILIKDYDITFSDEAIGKVMAAEMLGQMDK